MIFLNPFSLKEFLQILKKKTPHWFRWFTRWVCLFGTGMVLIEGCMRESQPTAPYESLVWTNEWLQLRKRELALPLEIRRLGLFLTTPSSLENWKTTIEETLAQNLLRFHRVVEKENPEARLYIEMLPIRSQLISPDRAIYEIRGSFRIEIGEVPFRSNVAVFDRVYTITNYPEDRVYLYLISRWTKYLSEEIHYGWSISQDFSHIPLLGGTNETDVSFPWAQ